MKKLNKTQENRKMSKIIRIKESLEQVMEEQQHNEEIKHE